MVTPFPGFLDHGYHGYLYFPVSPVDGLYPTIKMAGISPILILKKTSENADLTGSSSIAALVMRSLPALNGGTPCFLIQGGASNDWNTRGTALQVKPGGKIDPTGPGHSSYWCQQQDDLVPERAGGFVNGPLKRRTNLRILNGCVMSIGTHGREQTGIQPTL